MSRTINLTPDVPELLARNLDRLIDTWLAACRSTLPAYTVAGYADKVGYWRRWWAAEGPARDWLLREEDAVRFVAWLDTDARTQTGRNLSYNTKKDVVRRLRQLWRWALDRGHVDRDYGAWFPAPNGSAPLRKAADRAAILAVLEAAGCSNAPLRNPAIVAVLAGTGIRRAECAGLQVEDVTLDADGSGVLQVNRAKKVRGRDVHARLVAFDAATGKYLRLWIDTLPPTGPLWPAERGDGALTPQGVYKVVKQAIRDAGMDAVLIGPHDLRRAFATTFARYRRGPVNDLLLSQQLGHSGGRMTTRYTLLDVTDVRAALVSPLSA